uniref:Macaca fascicularis brain cDNA clone: QmoA-11612, similar to human hypothetical protein MGC22679 (MGC22679), mRNA, RefSeq: NM_144711.3 n=1 Tax=Macaca fascicularis TaxID=9541 RepID=I7GN69_MACFA|nr:unnamed protein product [Macaca fascicularis]
MVLYSKGCKNDHILCPINSTSILLTLKLIQKKDKCMKMFMSAFFIITKIGGKKSPCQRRKRDNKNSEVLSCH